MAEEVIALLFTVVGLYSLWQALDRVRHPDRPPNHLPGTLFRNVPWWAPWSTNRPPASAYITAGVVCLLGGWLIVLA
ncbi:hypothetical protein [Conexibacter sp. SYSU D00693]|uniref:hypothetical protein n=1 Tax=Conexibacter sp. SYSU D00693 TaxID=2812560 RepID=UPI00196BB1EC|nr:hypothetical protein [Conexibacter sp. SYSU D00693]